MRAPLSYSSTGKGILAPLHREPSTDNIRVPCLDS